LFKFVLIGLKSLILITVGQSVATTYGQDPTRNICLKGKTSPVLSRLSGGSYRMLLSAGRRFALTYGYENLTFQAF
jgi:hypothetical protein